MISAAFENFSEDSYAICAICLSFCFLVLSPSFLFFISTAQYICFITSVVCWSIPLCLSAYALWYCKLELFINKSVLKLCKTTEGKFDRITKLIHIILLINILYIINSRITTQLEDLMLSQVIICSSDDYKPSRAIFLRISRESG